MAVEQKYDRGGGWHERLQSSRIFTRSVTLTLTLAPPVLPPLGLFTSMLTDWEGSSLVNSKVRLSWNLLHMYLMLCTPNHISCVYVPPRLLYSRQLQLAGSPTPRYSLGYSTACSRTLRVLLPLPLEGGTCNSPPSSQ